MTARRPSTPSLAGFRPSAPAWINRSRATKARRSLVCPIRRRASAAKGLAMKGFVCGANSETYNGRYNKHLADGR